MLTAEQRAFYAEHGYLLVEDLLSPAELARAREITARLVEGSRHVTESDEVYDLDRGHSAESPRLTRIKLPHRRDPFFRDLIRNSALTRVLTDLLGADTTLLTSKLNTKAPGGGRAVEWHQDWAFYPHTNDDLLAFGVMLEDVTPESGPLMVIPGSHRGPVLSHQAGGVFAGAIDPDDPLFRPEQAVSLTGRAGSVSVHHARLLHGSAPNTGTRPRMILFYEIASADAWPLLGSNSYFHALGQRGFWEDLQERMITGSPCLAPRLEPVPVRMPLPPAPDSSSIFRVQESAGAKSAFSQ